MLLNKNNLMLAKISDDITSKNYSGLIITEKETIATEGHFFVSITLPEDENEETEKKNKKTTKVFRIPTDIVLTAAKNIPKGKKYISPDPVIVDPPNTKTREGKITVAGMSIPFMAPELDPPDIKACIPEEKEDDIIVNLNIEYLITMLEAMKPITKNASWNRKDIVTFRIKQNKESPVVLSASGFTQKALGVIMPVGD